MLLPPSTLLIGPAGTGKTSSAVTLLAEGLTVNMLTTEPSAPSRVLEWAKKCNVDDSKFDWHFVSPSVPSWDSIIKSAEIVNSMALKDISNLSSGIAKPDGKQWIELIKSIAHFKGERSGRDLGDATEWDANTAFFLDGVTGISTMSRNLTVGLKPNPSPGEWGVMQSNILTLFQKLCADCKCYFICVAHVERETNEISGLNNITVSTLGAKLAPKLPPLFTNVVYAKRIHDKFLWSTADTGVDTKSGDLPLSDNLPPSFKPIVESFRARLKATSSAPTAQIVPLKP